MQQDTDERSNTRRNGAAGLAFCLWLGHPALMEAAMDRRLRITTLSADRDRRLDR
jgi:hypothetical protein